MSEFSNIIGESKPTLELAMRYRVQSVPTLILFKNGEPVWRTVGVQQQGLLESKIREYIPEKSDE